jgi:hemolysin D
MSVLSSITGYFRGLVEQFDRHDEREFLPAALEVVETPASPTGRATALLIIVFFLSALVWSFFGKVDVLATAPGRILPAGNVKVIQSLNPGMVRAIHVKDGDRVRAGQLLLELDPTQTSADRDRLSSDLMRAKLDVARLTALAHVMAAGGRPMMAAPDGVPADMMLEARASMEAQADQQAAKLADLDEQISQKSAEAAEVSATTDQIQASIPLLAEKEHIHAELKKKGYGTSLAYLDAQQQLSEANHQLAVQAERALSAQHARTSLQRQRDEAKSTYAAAVYGDLRKAQEQLNEMTQELIKAQDKSVQTELRAPVDGVVEQLSVHTLNGVVTPAQSLMIVVPNENDLVIEARLANGDVGFVHAGQSVKVKVETFNFTHYGLIDGKVVTVSRDVVHQDDPATGTAGSGQTAAAGGANAPAYVARISLSRTSMKIDGRDAPLQPGMAITAEIRTGDRTIIDYLLSPLARRTDESLHER